MSHLSRRGARLKLLEMLFPTLESIESRQVAVNRSKPADLRWNASLVLAVAVNEYLVQVPTLLLPNLRNGFPSIKDCPGTSSSRLWE